MKFFLLSIFSLALLLSSTSQTYAVPKLPSEDNRSNLFSLIAKRCEFYLPEDKLTDCQDAVSRMVKILNADVIVPNLTSYVFVAFRNNFIELLSSEKTTNYLSDLQYEMNNYLIGSNQNFNLWELTLRHYKQPEQAAKIIATLFQDTSVAKLQLLYLDKAGIKGNELFKVNRDLLSKTIDTMNRLFDDSKSKIDFQPLFYPKYLRGNLNRAIYHFYVPLYLSMNLKSAGVQKEMAFTAAFLLNLTYEFITTTSDYRYLLVDPEKLDSKQYEGKIKDIYAGYIGSAMGSEKITLKDENFLIAGFKHSTKATVEAMLAEK